MPHLKIEIRIHPNAEIPSGKYLDETIYFDDKVWAVVLRKTNKLIEEVLELRASSQVNKQ